MVNIHGCSKMMVNRCMELLRSRIACAQTRHIGKRVPQAVYRTPMAQISDNNQLMREREKTKVYQMNKRRSMWELDDLKLDQQNSTTKWQHIRLDDLMYKRKDIKERSFDCTWVNFPETTVVAKPKRQIDYVLDDNMKQLPKISHSRRAREERPDTAKPCDEEARHFITHWDNNNAMINRSRYVRASDKCPPPPMSRNVVESSRDRQRQFFY